MSEGRVNCMRSEFRNTHTKTDTDTETHRDTYTNSKTHMHTNTKTNVHNEWLSPKKSMASLLSLTKR